MVPGLSNSAGLGRTAPRPNLRRYRLAIPLAALAVFMAVASAGYMVIPPRHSALDALYMTVITIATVGYGHVHEPSAAGKVWNTVVIVGGLTISAITLSLIASMVIEGQVRRILGRRQLERKIAGLGGHVIVCGLGRMGAAVARQLREAGRAVVGVDSDPEKTTAAEEAGLLYILGDATDESTLTAAGVERAETLISCLASDADNVFVALTAHGLRGDLKIIARAQDEKAQDKLLRAGATRVVCPHVIGAGRLADIVLRPAIVDFVEVARRGVELELDELELSEQSRLVGRTLQELELPRRIGVHVVAVRRAGGQTVYHPRAPFRLEAGDVLILVGKRGAAEDVEQLQIQTE